MIGELKIITVAGSIAAAGGVVIAQTGAGSMAQQFPLIGGLVFVVVAFLGFLDRARRTIEQREERLNDALKVSADVIRKNGEVIGANVEALRHVNAQLATVATAMGANERLTSAYEEQTKAIVSLLEKAGRQDG